MPLRIVTDAGTTSRIENALALWVCAKWQHLLRYPLGHRPQRVCSLAVASHLLPLRGKRSAR